VSHPCNSLSRTNETVLQLAAGFQEAMKPCRTRAAAFQTEMNDNELWWGDFFLFFCERGLSKLFIFNSYSYLF
jgi:hypothetical protein